MTGLKDFSLEELKSYFKRKKIPAFCAGQIFNWVYKKRVEEFDLMTDLSGERREFLKDNFYFSGLSPVKREISADGAEKFLFKLEDSAVIETVLIPEGKRNTLCLSTQVGCKFKCKFCLSGQGGLKRSLKVSEIINQYLSVRDLISPSKITNVVFMGIGEPLDNFVNVVKAVEILMSPAGLSFRKGGITISTCGLAPEIKELAALNLGVKLSVSLHSADNTVRDKLMPVNKKYPLEELMKAVKQFTKSQKYPVTFEYTLIHNLNTSGKEALGLAKLLRTSKAKVNLIPYNGSRAEYKPRESEVDIFKNELKKRGVFFTLRKPRGRDIKAACGQLRASYQ